MRRLAALLLAGAMEFAAAAAPWQFDQPLDVLPGSEGMFVHLDGAGRAHIAVGDSGVALAWEDNRSGAPQVYLATRTPAGARFAAPRQISSGKEAFAPALAAHAHNGFVIVFEQDGAVWARASAGDRLGAALKLADQAIQPSIVAERDGRMRVVFVRHEKGGSYIHLAAVQVHDDGALTLIGEARRVEPQAPPTEQLYPSIAVTAAGITVAWEDRRPGHTIIVSAHAPQAGAFRAPEQINKLRRRFDLPYGKGPGAARPVLRAAENGRVFAVWLDKRNFQSGYDVYAAVSENGGANFGTGQKVQDEFGQYASQWHAGVAVWRERVAAAWDDDRDENADVFLAWPVGDGWSENLAVPGASGAGEQASPALAFDREGNLHLAWVERGTVLGASRLRYLLGRHLP